MSPSALKRAALVSAALALPLGLLLLAGAAGRATPPASAAAPGAPPLTIEFAEPSENRAVVYLPYAAKTANDQPGGVLALRVGIKNGGGAAVHLNKVEFVFAGANASIPADINIGPGKVAGWNTKVSNKDNINQNVFLPSPAPDSFKIRLYGDGFDAPAESVHRLAPHKSPTAKGSYLFPARATDLKAGEFWSARSGGHAPGTKGMQLFAYDMGVVAWNGEKWSGIRAGGSAKKNADHLIWGKPIYAMADGVVLGCRNDVPGNPDPPDDPGLYLNNMPSEEIHGGGNHFYIQHGDELVLYAHMQMGSLTKSLCQVGAQVKAGDKLGLAGNSGSSSGPHLHIHAIQAAEIKEGPLRPLPFHGIWAVERLDAASGGPGAPWVKVDGQGPPRVACLIWPSAMKPGPATIKTSSMGKP